MAFVDPDDLKPTGGFVDPDEVKPRTSLWEDVKIGYTDVANTLDTAGTLTLAGFNKGMHDLEYRSKRGKNPTADQAREDKSNKAYDDVVNNLKRRRKMRQETANPEKREQGFTGKLTSLVGSLPGQIAALPFSPIETGMNALDAGESGTTTAKLVGLDAASSAIGLAIPGFGGTLGKRMVKGATANTAQEYATREAMSRTAETPKMKEALAPTVENMALAAVMGGGTSGVFGKNKPKTNKPAADTSNIDDIVQSAKVDEDAVKIDMTDPGTHAAAYRYADDATVQRLEAALARRNEPNPTITVDSQGRGFVGDEIDVKNQFDAQQSLENRQRQLEQEVAQRASLDFNAAERARRENAPTGAARAQVEQAAREAGQTYDFLSQAKQSEIDATPYGDPGAQFGFTPEFGRVDENGIPIRADLSMEAQNVQNPLQRNLWGDELPGKANTLQGRSLTQALDRMPPGPERDAAISILSGQGKPSTGLNRGPSRGQRGAVDADAVKKMVGAAFRSIKTGEIVTTGPVHNRYKLPGAHNSDLTEWVAGFVDNSGKFYNRKEAAEAVGQDTPLRTEDVGGATKGLDKPVPFLNKGVSGNQHGAIDPKVFKEGFRGLNRWLSKLTEQPWVRESFPATHFETNQDGTPKILLHGTTRAFNDTPKGVSMEGLHAGYATAATLKATGPRAGKVPYRIGNTDFHYDPDNASAVYPIAIRKGNYPTLNKDYGTFDPMSIANKRDFIREIVATSRGKLSFDDVHSSFDSWHAVMRNNSYYMTPAEINASFAKVLKDELGIDGFFYTNTYESTKRKLMGSAGDLPTPQRGRNLAKNLEDSPSFVTWNDSNVVSLYDKGMSSLNSGALRGQRGAIDLDAVLEGVRLFKRGAVLSEDLLDKFKGTFYGDEVIKAMTENSDPLSHERLVWMSPDDFHEAALKRITSYDRVEKQERIREALKTEDGLTLMPQLFIKPNNKVPGEGLVVGHEGRHRMDVFKESGIDLIPVRVFDYRARNEDGPLSTIYKNLKSQEDTDIPFPQEFNSQKRIKPLSKEAGVLNIKETLDSAVKAMRQRYGAPQDTLETPVSPENISAKEQKVRKVKAASDILGTKLPEWTNVATEEEALAMSAKAKDIASNPYTRGTAPGNNFMAAYHKNPLLSFARKLFNDARGEAIKFSKQFVTAEDGLSTYIKEMSDDQKLKVSELLRSLDKHQVDYTPDIGQKVGLDANSMAFMAKHVEAGEAMWQWGQKTRAGQGVKDAPKRKGYTASMYGGDYFSLVTDKDGGVLAVIAAETPGEFAKAKAYYSSKFAGAKFSAETYDKARIKYKGSNRQALQFKDLSTILELISDGEGGFSKLQNAQHLDAVKAANKLFHFDAHNKRKKGVEGNLGNKPWLSAEQNARDRLDSVIRYYEEGAQYFALQQPLEQLRTLVARPELEHLKNTKDYLNDYVKNVEGTYLHDFGEVMNRAFNVGGTMAEIATNKIPVINNYVSPSNILKSSNWVKNKMSQMYMGWGNWVFLASQLMQPIQTGIPIMNLVGNRIGIDAPTAMKDMAMAGAEFAKFGINKALKSMGVESRLSLDPLSVEALEWGRLRGILDFTELERAYEGHKTELGRGLDNVAEVSMQIGESATRPPVFLAVVKMLSRVETDRIKLFETAENITNQIMADYHTWERPLMYNGLGVLSPHAGGLTTFKHNYVGTQVLLAKEFRKGNAAPIVLSMLQMIAFAGIMGAPFYGEFDQIYQELREWLSGERRSISQDFLENIPEFLKSGVISSLANLNAQGKFSAADMVPETLAKAAFPHLSGAYDIAENVAKAAMNPNETNMDNAAVSATPAGWKQAAKYGLQRDDEGWLIDKYGKRDVQRTDEEWKKAASTGLVPLDEATQRQRQFQNRNNEASRKERMIDLSKKFSEAVINDANPEEISVILNEYEKAGGDVPSLLKQISRIQQEAEMSTQERLEGRPTTPQGIRRYEEYNR